MLDELHPVSTASVSRDFGSVRAVSDVTCCLERGRITVFLGANGSGKTTLLRLLAGHLPPSDGQVTLFGKARGPGCRPPSQAQRKRLGYISQHPSLDPEMTGREVLGLFASLYGLSANRRAGDEALARHGLTAVGAQRIHSLSGGQRRRLHLAVGMLHNPEVLLLDEPSAGLDSDGKADLWQELTSRAAEGCAVGVVSHDMTVVEHQAHRAYLLRDSQLVAYGSPAELIARHGLDFLGAVAREGAKDRPGGRGRHSGSGGPGSSRGSRGLGGSGAGKGTGRGRGR